MIREQDYFRHLTQVDLKRVLERYNVDEDAALRVPPVGREYQEFWDEDEAIERKYMEEDRKRRSQSAGKSKPSNVPKKEISPGGNDPGLAGGTGGPNAAKSKKDGSTEELLTTIISPLEPGDDPSDVCDVCNEGESIEGNLILFCDKCNVAVHQICYGVKNVPSGEWLCRRCEEGLTPKQGECILCPRAGGALKPCAGLVSGKKVWVHLFCSQWIPETYIKPEDTEAMEPVQNVCNIPKSRWKLQCVLCKEKHGACIQCSYGFCAVPFHPSCARKEQLLMEVSSQGVDGPVELKGYCSKHSRLTKGQGQRGKDAQNKRSVEAAVPKKSLEIPVTPPATIEAKKEPDCDLQFVEASTTKAEVTEKAGTRVPDDTITGDLLDNCLEADLVALVNQFFMLESIQAKELATAVGVTEEELLNWADGSSNVKLAQSVRGWVRELHKNSKSTTGISVVHSGTHDGDERKEVSASDHNGGDGLLRGSTAELPCTPSFPKPLDGIVDSGGPAQVETEEGRWSALVSRIPSEEYLHLYTQRILTAPRVLADPITLVPSVKVTSESKEAPLSEAENVPDAEEQLAQRLSSLIQEGREEMSADEEWAQLETCTEFFAIAPEDEVLSEILILQTELIAQMLKNKNRLDALGEEILKDLPEQQARVEKQVQATLDVYTYIEAWKANKRIQKKVLREQQQKAAIQSAVDVVALKDPKIEGASKQFIDEYVLASTEEAVCVICGSGESDEKNPIVFCERCEIPVHQKCYSISAIPEGDWLCWPCKEYEDGLRLAGKDPKAERPPRWQRKPGTLPELPDLPKCMLCPIERGAFKRSKGGKWVHVYCAKHTPEITLRDNDAPDAVEGLGRIKPEMLQKHCSWCGLEGAVLHCSFKDCSLAFHPMCARRARFHMQTKLGPGGKTDYRFYCEKHSPMMRAKLNQLAGGDGGTGKAEERTGVTMEEFKKLRRMRFEFERLRTICDRIVKREKLKSEAAMCAIDLARASVKDPFASLQPGGNQRGMKRGLEDQEDPVLEASKRLCHSEERLRLDRERLMTPGEAQATNNRLPKGYLYVPLDSFVNARGTRGQAGGSSEEGVD